MWKNFDENGGGFMSSPNTTQASPAARSNVRRVQNVVPLVIRQIVANKDEEFKLYDLPVQMAHIVGILKDFDVQSTKVTCTIQDHTGQIQSFLWLEADDDGAPEIPQVKEGCYVQAFGRIRNKDGEKILMILKMDPVDDCNIITNHLLQCIYARTIAEDQKTESAAPNTVPTNTNYSMSAMNETTGTSGFSKMQQRILDILRNNNNPAGVSRDTLFKNFASHELRDVKNSLDFLLQEGHTYTTVDNDHFKVTDLI